MLSSGLGPDVTVEYWTAKNQSAAPLGSRKGASIGDGWAVRAPGCEPNAAATRGEPWRKFTTGMANRSGWRANVVACPVRTGRVWGGREAPTITGPCGLNTPAEAKQWDSKGRSPLARVWGAQLQPPGAGEWGSAGHGGNRGQQGPRVTLVAAGVGSGR